MNDKSTTGPRVEGPIHSPLDIFVVTCEEREFARCERKEDAERIVQCVNDRDKLAAALARLERAVDLHLGRSSWTQTRELKGMGYSEAVRKELYAAHDEARAAISKGGTGGSPADGGPAS